MQPDDLLVRFSMTYGLYLPEGTEGAVPFADARTARSNRLSMAGRQLQVKFPGLKFIVNIKNEMKNNVHVFSVSSRSVT